MSGYGDRQQPAPIPNGGPACWDLVIADVDSGEIWTSDDAGLREIVLADMRDRDAFGRGKYPTPLQPNNGRDALADFYQEMLDGAVYARQAVAEGNAQAMAMYVRTLDLVFQVRALILARRCVFDGRTDSGLVPPGGFAWSCLGGKDVCSVRCKQLLCARETDGAHVHDGGPCQRCGRPAIVSKYL